MKLGKLQVILTNLISPTLYPPPIKWHTSFDRQTELKKSVCNMNVNM